MRKIITNKQVKSSALKASTLMLITAGLTGCMAPLLLGVKEVKTAGGTQVKFITGGDFKIGANGVDTVNDQRGIRPEGYTNVKQLPTNGY